MNMSSFVDQLNAQEQAHIQSLVQTALIEQGYTGDELAEALQDALDSRVSDLTDLIDLTQPTTPKAHAGTQLATDAQLKARYTQKELVELIELKDALLSISCLPTGYKHLNKSALVSIVRRMDKAFQ